MADVKWIKVYVEMFKDSRKIKDIEAMPKGDTYIVIWLKLLLLAGEINDGGAIYVVPGKAYTDEGLANELRRPVKVVKAALDLFCEYNMMVVSEGIPYIKNWGKYQNEEGLEMVREQSRIRKQRQREREKMSRDTSRDSHVTKPECHAIEEREEENLEYSFIHSLECAQENDEDFEESVENSVENFGRVIAEKLERQRKHLQGIGKGVVMLSDDEISSLLEELSIDEFDKYVGIVADCELRGQHYRRKTHYRAILDMAKKDRQSRG